MSDSKQTAGAQAKKNNKKKTKKKASESEAEQAKQLNPNAEIDDGGWEEVRDVRREKAKARSDKKKKEAEAKHAAEVAAENAANGGDAVEPAKEKKKKKKTPAPAPVASKPAATANGKKGGAGDKKGQQQQQQQQGKKKDAKPNEPKRPQTADDLVNLIKNILDSNPQGFAQVAAIGDRIQAITKCAWNKTYKPQFGTLKDFITGRTQDFHVDATLERVYQKSVWQQIHAQKTQQQAQTQAKKAAKKSKPASAKKSHTERTSEQSGDNFSLKILAVLGLLVAVVGATVMIVRAN